MFYAYVKDQSSTKDVMNGGLENAIKMNDIINKNFLYLS